MSVQGIVKAVTRWNSEERLTIYNGRQNALPLISGIKQKGNEMNKFKLSIIGGAVGWFIGSMLYGETLPLLSLPAILAVLIGGVVGGMVESRLSRDKDGKDGE
jgi:hypothetical protein